MRVVFLSLSLLFVLNACGYFYTSNGHYRERWREQAFQGDRIAQYHYGNSFCCGGGPFRSQVKATRWLCKSARQGYAPAMNRIGDIWRGDKRTNIKEGKVIAGIIPENNRIAYAWYDMAYQYGHKPAKQNIDELLPIMTEAEIKEGIRMQGLFPNMMCEMEQW